MRINLSGRIISRDNIVNTNQQTYNQYLLNLKSKIRLSVAPSYIKYGR